MKLLSELVGTNDKNSSMRISGLASDSRNVLPGFLFAAFSGTRTDGVKFIPDAIKRGAVAVLAQHGTIINNQKTLLITDKNPRHKFAEIASRFYCSQPEWVAAVTGTNGKTSVANFALQIWSKIGLKSAVLGTLGVRSSLGETGLMLTTPDSITLHRELANLASAGINRAVIEASSHGLDQHRLDGVSYKAAAFTNLTHDHLDYHGSIEKYLAAKQRLFEELLVGGGTAVINRDCPEYEDIETISKRRNISIISYGCHAESDLRLISTKPCNSGQKIEIAVRGNEHSVLLPLFGDFQSINALCALGLVIASGEDPISCAAALGHLRGIRGRLDLAAELPNRAKIFVDYAHTPAALDHTLSALRKHTRGRLLLVFGCGGDRDKMKRTAMGKIAQKRADCIIVTNDNPRTENPKKIRESILQGCPKATELDDRRRAIQVSVSDLHPGDILVVAGKGHETGQVVGNIVRPFDDLVEVKRAAALLGESNH